MGINSGFKGLTQSLTCPASFKMFPSQLRQSTKVAVQ